MTYIAVDPGSNYTGLSIFNLDDNNLTISNIIPRLLDLTDSNDLHTRLLNLYNVIYDISYTVQPVWLAIESSFINRFRPGAVIPIAKSINTIELAYTHATGLNNVTEIPPSIAKAIIAKYGLATKENIKQAILSIPDINKFIPDNLSEHEYDSIAIGYTFYRYMMEKPEILLQHI